MTSAQDIIARNSSQVMSSMDQNYAMYDGQQQKQQVRLNKQIITKTQNKYATLKTTFECHPSCTTPSDQTNIAFPSRVLANACCPQFHESAIIAKLPYENPDLFSPQRLVQELSALLSQFAIFEKAGYH